MPSTVTPTTGTIQINAADYVDSWIKSGGGTGPWELDVSVVNGNQLHVVQADWHTVTPLATPVSEEYIVTEGTGGAYQGDPYEVRYTDYRRDYIHFWLSLENPQDPQTRRLVFKAEGSTRHTIILRA